MMASIEQLVAAFENSPAAASSTAAQTSSTDGTSAGGTSASASSGSGSDASMDGISVDLPNGLSVTVFHADQGGETSADSAASFAQMTSTMEQLVAALDKYPGAAASAYANAGANASGASTTTGSLNAVA
jgi:BRCT domain type II-containing protein